jgi:hypothetical protein
VIERMLADPRRILQVRKDMHLGQTVRFMDWRDGQHARGQGRGHEGHAADAARGRHAQASGRCPTRPWSRRHLPRRHKRLPASHRPPRLHEPGRNDFRCGEKVAFEDKYLNTVVGTIVRINQRTATIDPGDGTTWRVGFALLRHVLDI